MKNLTLNIIISVLVYGNLFAQGPYNGSGNWLELDGIDDYASIANNPSLDIGIGSTDDFTIECFFYIPNSIDEGIQILLIKGGSYFLYLWMKHSEQDRIIFIIYINILKDYMGLTHDVDLIEGWHHLAASFDNEYTSEWDAMQIFLDGQRIENATNFEITPGIYNSTNPLSIGANIGANPFHGRIDEVRISDNIRYGSSYTVPTSDFIVDDNTRTLWHFNELTGSTSFNDMTTNDNNLTGYNGAQTLPDEYTQVYSINLNHQQKSKLTLIYPNPSNSGIFMFENKSLEKFEIEIYNINSQLIFKNKISGRSVKQIDLSCKSQGVYIIRIFNEKYNKTERLLIE